MRTAELRRRRWALLAMPLLLTPLVLSGCEDAPPPPRAFPPLSYTYLTPLHLNVLSLDVQDHSAPSGPDDVAAQSPVTPQQALTQMAHDRLFPGGSAGQAVFVIDNAVIDRVGGTLDGALSVHLDITGPNGARLGYAEAHVSRHHAPGDGEDRAGALYDLTRQMMADMNVEFEYQVRQSLAAFLQSDAVVPAPVQALPLTGGPGAAPAVPVPAYPPADGTAGTEPRGMSPPATYLRPPGYVGPPPGPPPGAVADPGVTPAYPSPGSYSSPGSYQPPAGSYQPPAGSYQPPSAPVYQPPSVPTPNPNGPIQLAPTY